MIEVVDRRDGWVGLRSRPATDWKRALVEYGTYSIRAKWRSLQSAQGSMLKKDLDTADIVRDGLITVVTFLLSDRLERCRIRLHGMVVWCPGAFSLSSVS